MKDFDATYTLIRSSYAGLGKTNLARKHPGTLQLLVKIAGRIEECTFSFQKLLRREKGSHFLPGQSLKWLYNYHKYDYLKGMHNIWQMTAPNVGILFGNDTLNRLKKINWIQAFFFLENGVELVSGLGGIRFVICSCLHRTLYIQWKKKSQFTLHWL